MTATKKIKSIKGKYNFTAHDKKAIRAGFDAGASAFKTPRKTYEISKTEDPYTLKVVVSFFEKNDYGRPILNRQTGVIELVDQPLTAVKTIALNSEDDRFFMPKIISKIFPAHP